MQPLRSSVRRCLKRQRESHNEIAGIDWMNPCRLEGSGYCVAVEIESQADAKILSMEPMR